MLNKVSAVALKVMLLDVVYVMVGVVPDCVGNDAGFVLQR